MMNYGVLITFAIILIVLPTISNTIVNPKPMAEDWNRHLFWINFYIKGDFTPFFTYPPFFHFLMLPFVVLFGNGVKWFQVLFIVLSTISTLFLTFKLEGRKAMLIMAFMLATSVIFGQFGSGLFPTAIAFILFPLLILLFFHNKYLPSAVILLALVYNHLFGVIYYFIILFWSFKYKKEFVKYAVIVLILSIPTIYAYYLPTAFNIWSPVRTGLYETNDFAVSHQLWQNSWDRSYTYPIQNFLFFSGFLTWLFVPLIIYGMKKTKTYSKYQLFYVVWMFFLSPLIIFNLWRWMSYFIIPFSLFEVSVLRRLNE